MNSKNIWPKVLLLAMVLGFPNVGLGQSVVPNNLANTAGNSAAGFPFDGFLGSMRYQQVFDASQFSAFQTAGGTISAIGFRLAAGCRPGFAEGQTIASLQIDLSTTSKGPDSLSPVFADNVGLNDTSVRGARSLSMLLTCTSPDPQLFTWIAFDTPFFYNPKAGNLLLDIRNFSGPNNDGSSLALDAQNVLGDSISQVTALDVNATTASIIGSGGFVTGFQIQAVPEPSIWALLALGLAGLGLSIHRKSKRRPHPAD